MSICLPYLILSQHDTGISEYYLGTSTFLNGQDYQKAYDEFEISKSLVNKQKNISFYAYALDYQIYSCIQLDLFSKAMLLLKELELLVKNDNNLKCDNSLITDIFILKSSINYEIGNIESSVFNLNKALDLLKKGADPSYELDSVYQLLGYNKYVLGDYYSTIDYLEKCLKLNSDFELNLIWNSMTSLSYSKLNNKLKSNQFYQKVTQELTNLKDKKGYFLINVVSLLARIDISNNLTLNAKLKLDDIPNLRPKHHELLNYYQIYGTLLININNFTEAESYFLKGINLCLDTFTYNKYKLAETYLLTSNAYNSVDKTTEGLKYNKDCLETLIPNFNESVKIDPSISLNHRLTVEALILKAELLSKNGDYKRAKIAIKQSQLYLDHMFHKKLLSQESRLFFVNKMKTDYEKIILIALENNDPEFAFEVSQKIHGNLLSLELFKDEVAERFNVPPEYTDYVQSLKVRISTKESNLSRLDRIKESVKYDSLENNLQYFKGELNNVLSSIEKKYPEYYKLKYTSPDINSIKNIQQNDLSKSSALIEYFMGKDNMYTFIISKKDIKVLTTEIDTNLVNQISILHTSIRSLNGDFNNFTSSSTYLYNYLLKDAIDHLGPSISKLYIIPDNEINYVPFEVLIDEVPELAINARYDLLPYVVKDYSISYHYSSALLDSDNTSLSDNITGFAPSFTSSYSKIENLESLLFNKKEVLIIKDITDGQIKIDTAANLKNIKQSFNNYRIAHLATHATCNDTLPFESKIYFEDGPLHAYEIYNMPHKLDLAVLSACETGTGALKKGEGLMSLARAFISSGCRSVITSLWSVNDQKSVEIMEYFYTHLYNGDAVGQSLTQAKRDYLKNVNSVSDAHPYHWATFIMVGNADMAIPTFPWIFALASMCILLLVSMVYLFIKKKR